MMITRIYTTKKRLRTANLRTKILDFRGFDSSRIFILRGGILRPIGSSPKMMSQRISVGIIFVGRLGVAVSVLSWGPCFPILCGGSRFFVILA